jgi:hypothetical protein
MAVLAAELHEKKVRTSIRWRIRHEIRRRKAIRICFFERVAFGKFRSATVNRDEQRSG